MSTIASRIKQELKKTERIEERKFSYGTAGFRASADVLDRVVSLCGFVAAVRSFTKQGDAIGLCVTASHNPEEDNGVKIVDPVGEMLGADFEKVVSEVVNAPCHEKAVLELVQQFTGMDATNSSADDSTLKNCLVVLGRDTRKSSPRLSNLVADAVIALGCNLLDIGVVTTPQLHFAVMTLNQTASNRISSSKFKEEPAKHFSDLSKEVYYRIELYNQYFTHAAETFAKCLQGSSQMKPWTFICDASNGVGSLHVMKLVPAFKFLGVDLTLRNSGAKVEDVLNKDCGAEFVQKQRRLPRNFGPQVNDPVNTNCFSFDGDADRLIFFLTPSEDQYSKSFGFDILDGDRQTAIVLTALKTIISKIVTETKVNGKISVCVVQTAYANGASGKYIKQVVDEFNNSNFEFCTINCAMAKTGVKYLHHEAVQHDIGIYFESNGHGTVVFKEDKLLQWADGAVDSMKLLRAFLGLYNRAVGDAQADALAFIGALRLLGMDMVGMMKLYPDLKVVQGLAHMERSVLDTIRCTREAEDRLSTPPVLQDAIDEMIRNSTDDCARAFIRPSGTEDACRLYVEASTTEEAEKICQELQRMVSKYELTIKELRTAVHQ